MLKLHQLHYEIYQDEIVKNFSLELNPGQIKTLFGPSGCGKTTVLRLVSGLNKPKKGKIQNHFKKIGFMFQENRLLEHLTALKNIEIFMPQPDLSAILTLGEKLGLKQEDFYKYPTELSGGMAKRIAFMRLLLCQCDLALLDEPFVGLDRDLRNILTAILMEKVDAKQLACLLVTHDRFEAVRLSHEILLLDPKGMGVEKVITLTAPLSARHSLYEEQQVKNHFGDKVYHA